MKTYVRAWYRTWYDTMSVGANTLVRASCCQSRNFIYKNIQFLWDTKPERREWEWEFRLCRAFYNATLVTPPCGHLKYFLESKVRNPYTAITWIMCFDVRLIVFWKRRKKQLRRQLTQETYLKIKGSKESCKIHRRTISIRKRAFFFQIASIIFFISIWFIVWFLMSCQLSWVI